MCENVKNGAVMTRLAAWQKKEGEGPWDDLDDAVREDQLVVTAAIRAQLLDVQAERDAALARVREAQEVIQRLQEKADSHERELEEMRRLLRRARPQAAQAEGAQTSAVRAVERTQTQRLRKRHRV